MDALLHRLEVLLPADEFTLLAVILLMPLLGAFVNGVFGRRLGDQAVSLMGLASIAISFAGSVVAFALLAFAANAAGSGESGHAAAATTFVWRGWEWLTLSARAGYSVPVEVAFSIDPLSAAMALVVTGVGLLIHLYSTKYMEGDPGYYRFFSYLNLFIFSMLVLVLGKNLVMVFIGWEGVGLCSYLLIGFWFEDGANAAAGKKAFITNRVGDFGLIVAMAMLVYYVGSLDFGTIAANRSLLLQDLSYWPPWNRLPLLDWMQTQSDWSVLSTVHGWVTTPWHASVATIVALALFLGCVGKSAQIPLYVWLPDAMAGPTPVSALIHAATMVTAGVYLVCRMAPVFALSPFAMFVVAFVGVSTAVFAASIALVQNDIKKVLAYSTISQLGFMFLGVGVGAFAAGFFHVVTHAFFKACLFLGAGSVIHAMHARIHATDAAQDLRNLGGLRRFMPHTHWTFLASVLAIAGFPLTAGFFSKDEILYRAWTSHLAVPVPDGKIPGTTVTMTGWPAWGPSVLFWLGVAAAVLTAFYMGRLYLGIFWGEFRGWRIVRRFRPRAAGHHDGASGAPGAPLEGPMPRESPLAMTVPLMVLGALALVGGFLNPHQLAVLIPGFHFAPVDDFLAPVFATAQSFGEVAIITHTEAGSVLAALAVGISVVAALAGLGIAYFIYAMRGGTPARELAERVPWLHRILLNRYWIDEVYQEVPIGTVDTLASAAVWVDRWLVDGVIAGISSGVVRVAGTVLRLFQTGRVQVYATAMVIGVAGVGWFFALPHAAARAFGDDDTGRYSLTAAPGLGYGYRWDADGDGAWDSDGFGQVRDVRFTLERERSRTVRLEVENAFGLRSMRRFEFTRPKVSRARPAAGRNTVIEIDEAGGARTVTLPDGRKIELEAPSPAEEGAR
ncbi:MAG: NADH-quinone oxidoreductase subunit L [Polyangiaceae bacterium]|nr:NADH-quinone oxidoreductase subunit L [Polyangiaceae bacterium]